VERLFGNTYDERCALYINRAQMDALFADKGAVRPWQLCIFTGKALLWTKCVELLLQCNIYVGERFAARRAPQDETKLRATLRFGDPICTSLCLMAA
jgi:hypothetical protein